MIDPEVQKWLDRFGLSESYAFTFSELIDIGLSDEDIIAYVNCFEEINPELSEEIALRRMDDILSKYNL